MNSKRIRDIDTLSPAAAAIVQEHDGLHANMYTTQAGVKTEPHFDYYDIIIVQLVNRKWFHFDDETVRLNAGESLEIPKGKRHWTETKKKGSVHLTIRKEDVERRKTGNRK